jgi:hypothetical protein
MRAGFRWSRFSEREKEREKMGKGNHGVLATRNPRPLTREPGVRLSRKEARQKKEL